MNYRQDRVNFYLKYTQSILVDRAGNHYIRLKLASIRYYCDEINRSIPRLSLDIESNISATIQAFSHV
jgi:hypothetical protein